MKRCIFFLTLVSFFACARPDFVPVEIQSNPTVDLPTTAASAHAPSTSNNAGLESAGDEAQAVEPAATPEVPVASVVVGTATPAVYAGVPTPDFPHSDIENGLMAHTVLPGESLGSIAQTYSSTIDELLEVNGLEDSDFLQVGQLLRVPLAADLITPSFKIIPDSELVYGPSVRGFEIREFLTLYYPQSVLLSYRQNVEGQLVDGAGSLELAAVRFSLNPRLLLAMVEYRTGWVTAVDRGNIDLNYPMGHVQNGYEGLYNQLTWAADQVNKGYYGRAERGQINLLLADNTRVTFEPTLNDGTAGVLTWLGGHTNATYDGWLNEIGESGFAATYRRLFGNPFGFSYEPILSPETTQPELTLPWAEGVAWYMTSGGHGGWASGAAWAALDFAPEKEARGCYLHAGWAVAAAAGKVAFSDFGGVLLDLDGDGDIGTGWVLVYWHLDNQERIQAGSIVAAGQNLGHPSCEGGFSNGTHLHFARRYNGHWIAANGERPFVLDGWVSQAAGREYDGYLVKGETVKEACVCATELNEILR